MSLSDLFRLTTEARNRQCFEVLGVAYTNEAHTNLKNAFETAGVKFKSLSKLINEQPQFEYPLPEGDKKYFQMEQEKIQKHCDIVNAALGTSLKAEPANIDVYDGMGNLYIATNVIVTEQKNKKSLRGRDMV